MGRSEEIFKAIKGFMIESYLFDGRQDVIPGKLYKPGLSITDACLGWEKTRDMLFSISDKYATLCQRMK